MEKNSLLTILENQDITIVLQHLESYFVGSVMKYKLWKDELKMSDLTRWVKKIFGVYEPGYEYWIRIEQIKVPKYMKHSKIKEEKYKRKWKHFRETGELESKIILDKDFNLLDGYSSYKIATKAELGIVPVYFRF